MPFPHETSPWLTAERVQQLLAQTIQTAKEVWQPDSQQLLLILPERQRVIGQLAAVANQAIELLHAAGYQLTVALAQYPGAQAWSEAELELYLPALSLVKTWRATPDTLYRTLGEVPASIVSSYCGGLMEIDLPITWPAELLDQDWAGILNLEWVTPHELLGFSGAPQNIWLGLAAPQTQATAAQIASSLGIENNLANIVPPLRQALFWADQQFATTQRRVDIQFVGGLDLREQPAVIGCYAGVDQTAYLPAALLSRQKNVHLTEPLQRAVVLFPGDRFQQLWDTQTLLARVRMAMADGGEVICIAPGIAALSHVATLAEQIQAIGYTGRVAIYEQSLADDVHAWWIRTHLLTGSTEGRFQLQYATNDAEPELLARLNLRHTELAEVLGQYRPQHARTGWNLTRDGQRFYLLRDPAAGLWSTAKRLENRLHEFARRTWGKY
jgi:hypothetical protein